VYQLAPGGKITTADTAIKNLEKSNEYVYSIKKRGTCRGFVLRCVAVV